MKKIITFIILILSFNFVNAQQASLLLNVGSSIPAGGIFSRDYNSSFNFGAGLEVKINNKFNVSLEFSNSAFKSNLDTVLSIYTTLKTYILSLNFKYNLLTKEKLIVNTGIGLGYDYYKLDYSGIYPYSFRSSSKGSYGVIPQINLEYQLMQRVYLVTSFDYNLVLKNELKLYEVTYPEGTAKELDTYNLSYYQIKFGFRYIFKL